MTKRIILFLAILSAVVSCSEDDLFTTSQTALLNFSTDTVKVDTVFTSIGSRMYDFWVYNTNKEGIRLKNVRLQNGNQSGFRVNVDGSYLDNSLGSVVTDLEIRKGDSIRVFVELTAPENKGLAPQMLEDNILFTLESGITQKVNLRAVSWDADIKKDLIVKSDTIIESSTPIVIYGNLIVDSAAVLTIKNSTLYFHDGAGVEVYGTLVADNVVFRGDRLDHMFDYLPYDRVSGLWKGIRLHASSTDNVIIGSEIRNAVNGLVCDSAAFSEYDRRLYMERSIVHNSKGHGVELFNAYAEFLKCQFTNAQGDCFSVHGGLALVDSCTVGQFYPFVGGRGAALRFSNFYKDYNYPLVGLQMKNSIVTGYDEDVVMGESKDSTVAYGFYFENSLLRTPEIKDSLQQTFVNVKWESAKDSIQGKQHFVLIDEENLKYDFHLDSLSTAHGMGCY
ncbi:MAG: right-handed parallel beta-helix repeat-containing protein [Prevotella sp.]|nr:right-handed parallel beta-helix repeat-containing protein [Prevotella sp.]